MLFAAAPAGASSVFQAINPPPANTATLQELLGFLYAECCTRNRVVEPETIVCCK